MVIQTMAELIEASCFFSDHFRQHINYHPIEPERTRVFAHILILPVILTDHIILRMLTVFSIQKGNGF